MLTIHLHSKMHNLKDMKNIYLDIKNYNLF